MRIVFDDGICEDIEVEPLSGGEVRLLQTPLASATDARYGDAVELKEEGQVHLFQRITARSPLVTTQWTVTEAVAESAELQDVLSNVRGAGGHWERAYGGMMLVHTPDRYAEKVRQALERIVGNLS